VQILRKTAADGIMVREIFVLGVDGGEMIDTEVSVGYGKNSNNRLIIEQEKIGDGGICVGFC
jgi:hypothetical protein